MRRAGLGPARRVPSFRAPVAPGAVIGVDAADEARTRAAYARRSRQDPRYSWANLAYVFARQERERVVLESLARHGCMPLVGRSLLDVGCGSGAWLRDFVRWGARPADLHGLDLLPDSVDDARRLCAPGVEVECGSATRLPFRSDAFDIVLQATVLTTVLDPATRHTIAAEMLRVVRPGGIILWYDFRVNNPSNPDVRGIGQREVHDLFPGCGIALRRLGLVPPLARWLVPRSWLASYLLGRLPLLCTHYVGVIRRSPASRPAGEAA